MKEKLNFLQNSEEGHENNNNASIIQEIQESEMLSKLEEEYMSEKNNIESEKPETNRFNNENNNYFEKQINETSGKKNNFKMRKDDNEEDFELKIIRKIEERLTIDFDKRIKEEINQKVNIVRKEFYENLSENEKKITLLERKLYSFEEVKIN